MSSEKSSSESAGEEEKYEREVSSLPPRVPTPKITDCADIVTIEIPSGKKFTAHAHLLAQHSEYFRRALNSGMEEASSLHFRLTEHANDGSMSCLISWIYDDKAYAPKDWEGGRPEAPPDLVLNAWLLADYLQVTALQNHLVHLLLESHPFAIEFTDKIDAAQSFYLDVLKRGDVRVNSGMYRLIIALLSDGISNHTVETGHRQSVLKCLMAMQRPLSQSTSQNATHASVLTTAREAVGGT